MCDITTNVTKRPKLIVDRLVNIVIPPTNNCFMRVYKYYINILSYVVMVCTTSKKVLLTANTYGISVLSLLDICCLKPHNLEF